MTDVLERVKTYQQFIGGEWVDLAPARLSTSRTRPTARSSPRSRRPTRRTSIARSMRRRPPSRPGSTRPPPSGALMLLKLADAIEARADELGRLESRNAGKPVGAAIDEIPVVVDNLRFFAGAARVMEGKAATDLVITVDTSMGHLAGALGKPVWILIPKAADWRWMLEREDSPWYPSARLFRQQKPGDWDGPLARLRSALSRELAGAVEGFAGDGLTIL